MPKEVRDVKFQLMVSPSELHVIDEYRWMHRLKSRAEAARQLMKIGLKTKTAEGDAPASNTPTAV